MQPFIAWNWIGGHDRQLRANEPGDLVEKLYGSDCISHQLVVAINRFCYKDGFQKGSPVLRKCWPSKATVTIVQGNRLHIMFHISGMHHRDLFLKLFEETTVCRPQYCTTSSLLCTVRIPRPRADRKVTLRHMGGEVLYFRIYSSEPSWWNVSRLRGWYRMDRHTGSYDNRTCNVLVLGDTHVYWLEQFIAHDLLLLRYTPRRTMLMLLTSCIEEREVALSRPCAVTLCFVLADVTCRMQSS